MPARSLALGVQNATSFSSNTKSKGIPDQVWEPHIIECLSRVRSHSENGQMMKKTCGCHLATDGRSGVANVVQLGNQLSMRLRRPPFSEKAGINDFQTLSDQVGGNARY
jgi:hypothetical protein